MPASSALKVLLLGSDRFTAPHLRRLWLLLHSGRLGGLELMTAATGRCEARDAARELGVVEHVWREDFEFARFDLGVAASFGKFIPRGVIGQWRLGAINVHPSLLPRWRGSAPVLYSILAGDSETGVSIIEVSPDGFDKGAVLLQRRIPLHGDEEGPALVGQLAELGCDCLEAVLGDLEGARRSAVGQSSLPYQRSLAKRPDPSFACIDWERMDAAAVDRLARSVGRQSPLRCRLEFGGGRVTGASSRLTPIVLGGHLSPAEVAAATPPLSPLPAAATPGHLHFNPAAPGALFVSCSDGNWAAFRCVSRSGKPGILGPVEFYNGYLATRGSWAKFLGMRNGYFSTGAKRSTPVTLSSSGVI